MACCRASNSHDTAPLCVQNCSCDNSGEIDVENNFDVIRTIHDDDDD